MREGRDRCRRLLENNTTTHAARRRANPSQLTKLLDDQLHPSVLLLALLRWWWWRCLCHDARSPRARLHTRRCAAAKQRARKRYTVVYSERSIDLDVGSALSRAQIAHAQI